jgi:hypothetical protein
MIAPQKTTDAPPAAFADTDQLVQGVFEPPSGFALMAIARNKLIVCAFAVVLALAGLAYGLSRPRTYTASATLQVGQVNPNSPGFYSYVLSSAALASAFSHAIGAEPVLATVQRKLALPPAKAVARLSAEPLPQSPAFKVIATGTSEAGAVDLANVAAGAIIAYEGQSNSANPEAESLLHEYREASLRLQRASAELARLEQAARASHTPRSAPSNALSDAEAERNAAAVKLKAVGVAYTAAVSSQAPRSGLVSLVAGATSASNNRRSKVEMYGFIGLLVGIVVGAIAAYVRERLRVDRQLGSQSV